MFGGGSASGLEALTYMSSNGPVGGILAIFIIAFLLGTAIFLVFELGRLYRAFDYHLFSLVILGSRAAPLYEIFITIMMFLSLAYATTVAGTALGEQFDLSRYAVTSALLVLVVFLTYQGRRFIEMTMVVTSILLLLCVFSIVSNVAYLHGDVIIEHLENTSIKPWSMIKNLSTYTIVVMAYVPIMLYLARELKNRRETLVAGYISGFVFLIPSFCMHLSFLSHYPEVLDQAVPNSWIAGEIMPPLFSDFFVVILAIAVLQTAVGLLHGFMERLDNWSMKQRNLQLSNAAHGTISFVVLLLCLALSSLGVVTLLARVYQFSFSISLLVFAIPLFTIGVYRIVSPRSNFNTA